MWWVLYMIYYIHMICLNHQMLMPTYTQHYLWINKNYSNIYIIILTIMVTFLIEKNVRLIGKWKNLHCVLSLYKLVCSIRKLGLLHITADLMIFIIKVLLSVLYFVLAALLLEGWCSFFNLITLKIRETFKIKRLL